MLNFPLPYTDELIYSTIARAGIRAGIVSPKQLLDEVFNNRKVIATFDMPCHLSSVVQLYKSNQYDIQTLIYKHTLFPIYSPFLPNERRLKCINWMKNASQGSVHLASGLNASRLPVLSKARYCPICIEEQANRYGEAFWSRDWQIIGADCCLKHNIKLIDSDLDFRSSHRHEFFQISETIKIPATQNLTATEDELFLTAKIIDLLHQPTVESPSYEQWSTFYNNLALLNDCLRGKTQIIYERIREKFLNRWDVRLLKCFNLGDLESSNNWLVSIFRKHRKSFSYLEHILVIEAFWGKVWNFDEIFNTVKHLKKKAVNNQKEIPQNIVLEIPVKQDQWLAILAENNFQIKQARTLNKALYSWLYRNDKEWLIKEHKKYQNKHISTNNIYDWEKRDKKFVKELLMFKNSVIDDNYGSRRSRNFWLKNTQKSSFIEKNLSKLPLVTAFFNRYSEDISEYQIRRLNSIYIGRITNQESLSEWIILREAGLSKEKMTEAAKRFNFAIRNKILNKTIHGQDK
ncbi:TnsD family Tn7-like transposition protein [Moraxella catarrhalis]|uniref:Transposon Tn7 transposition protein tnsD n=1 Tax=Moraxella catarrhalis TaxID=480 RepID=A0AB36DQD0_MORCA|nr:TnsD family Tn7-like transposition protein [Moraxella catarrhalis]MPX29257.1 transposase [Moraxella catarrhalis]OAV26749.1 Transposon Tn7 transposition protein tnsD [Moraxella catarrhalis]RKL86263.1 transposase [Moraxella catarrhalis]RKL87925.1 transposase [Moraxella catarrhalis]RKL98523.1 transposase [Moraxella catarrhalis]